MKKMSFSERSIIAQILSLVLWYFLIPIGVCFACVALRIEHYATMTIIMIISNIYSLSVFYYYARKIRSKKVRVIVTSAIIILLIMAMVINVIRYINSVN